MTGVSMETIELNAIDLRLEHTRHKDREAERRLLSSIMERDIQQPLQVSACDQAHVYVLLDGFKRYRCAGKVGMSIVPIQCIAQDVPSGVSAILRQASAGALSTMEQAALIQELYRQYDLSVYDIALRLERSPAWVSVRLGMIEQLSDLVREKIMAGVFPARAYLYGLKGFTRVNNLTKDRVDAFVTAVSGKGLSTRNLNVLSRAYFTGGPALRQLIDQGDVRRALAMLTTEAPVSGERTKGDPLAGELKVAATAIHRIVATGRCPPMNAASLRQEVNLWSDTILKRLDEFTRILKDLYDRSGPTVSSADTVPPGSGSGGDSAAVAHGQKDLEGDTA